MFSFFFGFRDDDENNDDDEEEAAHFLALPLWPLLPSALLCMMNVELLTLAMSRMTAKGPDNISNATLHPVCVCVVLSS